MKIINIPSFQLAIFKVEDTLHITVRNLSDEKTIDTTKLHSEAFNKAVQNEFEKHFKKQISSYTSNTAPSLFDSTTQVLIIILK
ncbi:hypothetical protein [Flavobacterium sp.]|uniref:hypothetical protein n=1 Tax=Flavobacterium sp. TaxID=239 RepID=UPI00260BA4A5|nr:hypothetical protein [Flavobacterium sp.]